MCEGGGGAVVCVHKGVREDGGMCARGGGGCIVSVWCVHKLK